MKVKTWHFVLFIHILFYCCAFLTDTKVYNVMKNHHYSLFIYYTILIILLTAFILATSLSNTSIKNDESTLNNNEELWFCQACNHYCPIRASHCKICKKCVLRKDHHCFFLGVCIGMHNNLFFIIFLILTIVFDITNMLIFSGSIHDDQTIDEWIRTSFFGSIGFYGSIISIIQPALLLPFHLFFIVMNITTWEFIKGKSITYMRDWNLSGSPFSRGVINNVKEFCMMRWTLPVYRIPTTEEEIEQWKEDNSCCYNDSYNCC